MNEQPDKSGSLLKCDDIQAVLLEYMTRELGANRSDLVREHLRRCPRCQAEASDIQQTLDMMRTPPSSPTGFPERLSDERRARMVRAFMHPLLDWAYRHHIAVSIVITLMALILLFCVLRRVKAWHAEKLDPGVPVLIGRDRHPEIRAKD